MSAALAIGFAYLVGSVPFGLIFTRSRGVDIRSVGSGNIGATNVLRAAGKGPAALTLLGDLLKGSAAVAVARVLGVGEPFIGLAGLAAIIGHNFPVFLGFKGGKGVATTIGVVLLYIPQAGILTVIIWLSTLFITRYSSLGAIVAFGALPVVVLVLGQSDTELAFAAVFSALIIIRHKDNIRRLIRGEEKRVGQKA